VLDRLLAFDFYGRNELVTQLANVLVERMSVDKDIHAVWLQVEGDPALWVRSIPVEGRGFDLDGVPIDFVLHVTDGFARELDVIKASGEPIERLPNPAELEVFIHP
jgi:hypothetical protein